MVKLVKLDQAFAIFLIYVSVGTLWILWSDQVAMKIFSNDVLELAKFQLIKGISYVLMTGILFYFLIRRLFNKVNRRNQQLELLFTNPNLGILKLDEEGNFLEISPNFLKITGYTPQELVGTHVNHLTPADKKEQDRVELEKIAKLNSKDAFVLTKHVLCKNGEEIIIKGYGIRDLTSKGVSYIAAIQNITEQVRFLRELEAHNKQLKEIASEQSHLVRAPLARILGVTNLLEGDFNLSEDEINSLLKNLKSSGAELDQALKDISHKMNHSPN